MKSDQTILKEAKAKVAERLHKKDWNAVIAHHSVHGMNTSLTEAALLALKIKGEEMEKEFQKEIDDLLNKGSATRIEESLDLRELSVWRRAIKMVNTEKT